MNDKARGIQSIEIGGRILKAFVDSARPLMLTEISDMADLKPAQCHAYLTSMKNTGLVHQDASSGLYAVGHFALQLGTSWLESDRQISGAITGLSDIAEELGATSLLFVWGKQGPTVAHIYAGPRQAALNVRQGSLYSIAGTSAGRVFAAFLDDPAVAEHLQAELTHTSPTNALGDTLTETEFDSFVSEIRKVGYSVVGASPVPGINTVAAPIFGPDGRLSCVVSLYGSIDDFPVDPNSPAVTRLLELTKQLSGSHIPDVVES